MSSSTFSTFEHSVTNKTQINKCIFLFIYFLNIFFNYFLLVLLNSQYLAVFVIFNASMIFLLCFFPCLFSKISWYVVCVLCLSFSLYVCCLICYLLSGEKDKQNIESLWSPLFSIYLSIYSL